MHRRSIRCKVHPTHLCLCAHGFQVVSDIWSTARPQEIHPGRLLLSDRQVKPWKSTLCMLGYVGYIQGACGSLLPECQSLCRQLPCRQADQLCLHQSPHTHHEPVWPCFRRVQIAQKICMGTQQGFIQARSGELHGPAPLLFRSRNKIHTSACSCLTAHSRRSWVGDRIHVERGLSDAQPGSYAWKYIPLARQIYLRPQTVQH